MYLIRFYFIILSSSSLFFMVRKCLAMKRINRFERRNGELNPGDGAASALYFGAVKSLCAPRATCQWKQRVFLTRHEECRACSLNDISQSVILVHFLAFFFEFLEITHTRLDLSSSISSVGRLLHLVFQIPYNYTVKCWILLFFSINTRESLRSFDGLDEFSS